MNLYVPEIQITGSPKSVFRRVSSYLSPHSCGQPLNIIATRMRLDHAVALRVKSDLANSLIAVENFLPALPGVNGRSNCKQGPLSQPDWSSTNRRIRPCMKSSDGPKPVIRNCYRPCWMSRAEREGSISMNYLLFLLSAASLASLKCFW